MAARRPTIWLHAFSCSDPTHGFMPRWEEHLRQHFEVVTTQDLEEDMSRAQQVTGAILHGPRKQYFEKHLPAFTHLRVVANFGAGTNHIDLKRLADLGVKVANTPDVLNDSVAEMTLTLLLASARNIVLGHHIVKDTVVSEYDFNGSHGVDVKGSTVGIVGMGSIGLTVARLLTAFRAKIVYHNRSRRSESDEQSVGATYYPDLLDMVSVCDFVVLLCPLTSATRHLITTRHLTAMKPTATLINVARGAVLDHDALLEALRTKQIRGAALDVTDPEPLPPGHPLRSCDQVLLTPHWGSQTAETRFTMLRTCVDNLRAALIDNEPMPNEVKL